MSNFKTKFQSDWLTDKSFSSWIQAASNQHQARCKLCCKTFELSNMGRQALRSHESSVQHKKNITTSAEQQTIGYFIRPKGNIEVEASIETVNLHATPGQTAVASDTEKAAAAITDKIQQSVSQYAYKDSVTKAEVLWTLQTIARHQSYRSCDDAKDIFQAMFPDSKIAQKFTLGQAKVAYTVVYGLAPYFQSSLTDAVNKCEVFVACFDEALNRIAQRGQMDIVVRFWDSSRNIVATRYLNSTFLGHATARDLEQKFKEGLLGLSEKKILQVSMDGPSVNWKFLDSLRGSRDESDRKLIDIGSCGLHVLHGALQAGHRASGWSVNEFLRAIYGLFKDSPARRADFTAVTGSTTFPKKFCQVRWIENVNVANRALEVLSNVKKYVEEKSRYLPGTVTCKNIQKACNDPLIRAKTQFFVSVALMVEPFLRKYQTNNPMVPFLYHDLGNCLRSLLTRFIKKEVLAAADSSSKLMKIKVDSDENWCVYKEVDLGVAAKTELAQCKISDREKLQFRMECIKFLSAMSAKIVERSPLKYNLVKFASSVTPISVLKGGTVDEQNFSGLVEKLYTSNNINATVADVAKVQYSALTRLAATEMKTSFETFTVTTDRLDAFYYNVLDNKPDFAEIWQVMKLIFVLSHGNAAVESGFSVNGDMLVENLHEASLVAQRMVFDSIKSAGGVLKVEIDKRLLQYVRGSRSRYEQAVKAQKAEKAEEMARSAAKRKVSSEIKVLEAKKAKLAKDAANAVLSIESEIKELKKLN